MKDPETGEVIGSEIVEGSQKCTTSCEVIAYVVEGGQDVPISDSGEVDANDCVALAEACANASDQVSLKCINDAADKSNVPTVTQAFKTMAAGCGALSGIPLSGGAWDGYKALHEAKSWKGVTNPRIRLWGPQAKLARGAAVKACIIGAGAVGWYSAIKDLSYLRREFPKEMEAFSRRASECYAQAQAYASDCKRLYSVCKRDQSR